MSEPIDELVKRCEEAQLKYTLLPEAQEESGDSRAFWLFLPRGREDSRLFVLTDEDAEELLELPFEKWRAITGYRAIWSPDFATIECALERAASLGSTPLFQVRHVRQMLEELGYQLGPESLLAPGRRMEFDLDGGLSVSIGPAGDFHGILSWVSDAAMVVMSDLASEEEEARLTMRIEGVRISTHDDAVEILSRIGDSLLFGLDLSLGLSLRLARGHDQGTRAVFEAFRQRSATMGEPDLPQVRYEYDPAPMSLYWYARAASEMPLLRFLASYQILEFYFPVYSERRAQGTLRNLLKDPAFNPDRDADVARLLRSVKAGTGGRGFGSEASQLKATIEECVSAEELRDFLLSDDERYRFYTSDEARKVVRERPPVKEKAADHREAVAKRIYAIRNRIVHTKAGGEEGEPLFPFDPEVAYLKHDIDLVAFLAQKTLVASSRPLHL